MKSTILYSISIFTLSLLAAAMIGVFFITFYPFNHVRLEKLTPLNDTYALGEMIEKKILICKEIDAPLTITLELINSDIVPLAFKKSYQPAGCKEYIVSQPIPKLTKIGEHKLLITVSYDVLFRTVDKTLQSDVFIVTASQSAMFSR